MIHNNIDDLISFNSFTCWCKIFSFFNFSILNKLILFESIIHVSMFTPDNSLTSNWCIGTQDSLSSDDRNITLGSLFRFWPLAAWNLYPWKINKFSINEISFLNEIIFILSSWLLILINKENTLQRLRLVCTLHKSYIMQSQYHYRDNYKPYIGGWINHDKRCAISKYHSFTKCDIFFTT